MQGLTGFMNVLFEIINLRGSGFYESLYAVGSNFHQCPKDLNEIAKVSFFILYITVDFVSIFKNQNKRPRTFCYCLSRSNLLTFSLNSQIIYYVYYRAICKCYLHILTIKHNNLIQGDPCTVI